MSFVIENYETPIAILSGGSNLVANAGLAQQFRAVLPGGSNLIAAGGNAIAGACVLPGGSNLYAFGRLGNEPNKFGACFLTGASGLIAAASVLRRGVAVLTGGSNLLASPYTALADSSNLNLVITVADDFELSRANVYSARVIADGSAIPIKGYSYNESSQTAGVDANFTLARQADRAAIESAENFTFEIYDRGAWREQFSAGRRTANEFSFSWSDARAADAASFSTAAPIAQRFEAAPVYDLTIYDPARLTLSNADFAPQYDTDGNEYGHELTAVSNLTLHDLFQRVFVGILGFAGFETNIEDFAIRRADFLTTESYLDGIAGHIGIFRPLFFVRDNIVWILSNAVSLPAGMPAPVALTADRYKSAQLASVREQIDGYVLQYSQDERDFDYIQNQFIQDPPETTGTFGSPDFSETNRSRTFRRFFKNNSPFVPVRAEKLNETTETRATVGGSTQTVSTETEQFTYNSFGLVTQIKTDGSALIPDLSDADAPASFQTNKRIIQQFVYSPDIYNPRRLNLVFTKTEHRGMYAIDTANQQLGKDFKQEILNDAFRAGNLKEGMTTEFGAIRTTTENIYQIAPGQFEIRGKTTNFLTDPPTVDPLPTENRAGDSSVNGQTTAQNTLRVYRAGVAPANAKLKSLTIAELPVKKGVALARRRLANAADRRGRVTLVGIDLSLRRGSVFELFDRDGFSVGNYLIEGFSIAGAKLGTREQTTEQILEVVEIPSTTETNEEMSASVLRVAPGGDRIFNLQFVARAGFTVSAVMPDGLTLFAKAQPGDGYQDISVTPLDLSAYAGTEKTVYFWLAADADAAEGDKTAVITYSL